MPQKKDSNKTTDKKTTAKKSVAKKPVKKPVKKTKTRSKKSQTEFTLGQGLGDLLEAAGVPHPEISEETNQVAEALSVESKKKTTTRKSSQKSNSAKGSSESVEKNEGLETKLKKLQAENLELAGIQKGWESHVDGLEKEQKRLKSEIAELHQDLKTQIYSSDETTGTNSVPSASSESEKIADLESALNLAEQALKTETEKLQQDLKLQTQKMEEAQQEKNLAQATFHTLEEDLKKEQEKNASLADKRDLFQEEVEDWKAKALAILNNTAILLYDAEMDAESIIVMKKVLKLDPENKLVLENLKSLEDEENQNDNRHDTGN